MQLCVCDGIKNCLAPFPWRAQPFHQANHYLVVRNQNFLLFQRERKMAIANFKCNFHRIVVTWRNNFEDRFDGGFDYQVPIRFDVQDRTVCESRSRRQRDSDFAPPLRCKSPAHPAPLLPGENKFVLFSCAQVHWRCGRIQAINDERISPHDVSGFPCVRVPILAPFARMGIFDLTITYGLDFS